MQASKATMISVNLFAKNQPHICLRCLARFVASKFPKCPFHNNLCLWMWTRAVDEISFPGKQENQLFSNRKFDQNEEQSKKKHYKSIPKIEKPLLELQVHFFDRFRHPLTSMRVFVCWHRWGRRQRFHCLQILLHSHPSQLTSNGHIDKPCILHLLECRIWSRTCTRSSCAKRLIVGRKSKKGI